MLVGLVPLPVFGISLLLPISLCLSEHIHLVLHPLLPVIVVSSLSISEGLLENAVIVLGPVSCLVLGPVLWAVQDVHTRLAVAGHRREGLLRVVVLHRVLSLVLHELLVVNYLL